MVEHHDRLVLVVGVYANEARAQQLVEKLIHEDYPMDRISLLSRAGGSGDDMLGVTYHDTGDRMKAWGKHGAFWGAIWGLLAGASGMFVLPGLGPLLVAGPIVEALGAAFAGAAVAGGNNSARAGPTRGLSSRRPCVTRWPASSRRGSEVSDPPNIC